MRLVSAKAPLALVINFIVSTIEQILLQVMEVVKIQIFLFVAQLFSSLLELATITTSISLFDKESCLPKGYNKNQSNI
jgi:hypothetical protein